MLLSHHGTCTFPAIEVVCFEKLPSPAWFGWTYPFSNPYVWALLPRSCGLSKQLPWALLPHERGPSFVIWQSCRWAAQQFDSFHYGKAFILHMIELGNLWNNSTKKIVILTTFYKCHIGTAVNIDHKAQTKVRTTKGFRGRMWPCWANHGLLDQRCWQICSWICDWVPTYLDNICISCTVFSFS